VDRINERVAISIVYMAAMFMSILDSTTIVNVALATISRDFDLSASTVAPVTIVYLFALAAPIPAAAWFGDRFGHKRVLCLAVLLFTLASAACGLAPTLPLLVPARLLQGLAGGLMTPVGMTMLYRIYGPWEREAAARWLALVTTVAPASGPILSGLLVEVSWRFVFLVNIPIGAAVLFIGLLCLRNHRLAEPGRFDAIGVILGGIGFGSLVFAISEGPALGWTSAPILLTAALALVVLAFTILFEWRNPTPMLHLRLFRNPLFRSVNVTFLIASMAFLGTLFLFPLYLQVGLGKTPLIAGLATFPEALAVILTTQVTTRLYPMVGPRRMLLGGLLIGVVAISLIAFVPPTANLWVLRALLFLLGIGQAPVFGSAQSSGFATISHRETSAASSLFNSARQAGGAIGISLISTTLGVMHPTLTSGHHPVPHVEAFRVAFLVAAAVTGLAALSALGVSDEDAAPTLRTRAARGMPDVEISVPS
jgi:EmrB/QacA subfamily drug resistance transporter